MKEPLDNTFILFRHDKAGNERRPDYTGVATIRGEVFEVAGWVKRRGDQHAFLAGTIKSKAVREAPKGSSSTTPKDSLPF
jgi:hypothetical protein